jgi:hypothetical protein
MKIVATPKATRYIQEHGGRLWVWLDPHRCLVGGYVYLEAATEPPGSSRRTKLTRSSRRPHRFRSANAGGFELRYDWGRMDAPDEIDVELRGWTNKRIEVFWNGCVFVMDDRPPPAAPAVRPQPPAAARSQSG